MKTWNQLPAIAAGFSLSLGLSHAQVIFTDTFDSGTGSWYQAGTVNTLSNSSGQLAWSGGVGGAYDLVRQAIGRSFSSQTLAVGQSIRVTFDYTQSNNTGSNIFRVGFYDVQNPIDADGWSTEITELVGTYSGYTGFIRDVGTPNPLRHETGTDTTNAATGPTTSIVDNITEISGNNTSYDIAANIKYKAFFELYRETETKMNAVLKLTSSDGLTTYQNITGSTSTIYSTFDTVVLRAVNPVLFDNIQVEVAPASPSSSPFQLVISRNGSNYDFEWNSQAGKLYDLITSTDLATPVASWPVHDPDGPGGADPLGDIPSAGSTTTLTGVASSDPRRFFSIREK